MKIDLAIQRYHERCRFYAWDIYEVLSTTYKRPYKVLQYLAMAGKPVFPSLVAAGVGPDVPRSQDRSSWEGQIGGVLKWLYRHDLATIEKQKGNERPQGGFVPRYAYFPSELGWRVIECECLQNGLPPKIPDTGKVVLKQPNGRWVVIEQEASKLRHEGYSWNEIAARLDIKASTLAKHFRENGLS